MAGSDDRCVGSLVVGVALIVEGVLKVVGGLRGTPEQRVTAGLSGLAGVVFGLLALSWPDVTLFVVAVVFGARLILFGVSSLWAAIRGRREYERTPRPAQSTCPSHRTGRDDNLIPPSVQAGYVEQRCDRGGDLDYRTYPGRDHVGLVADDSPLKSRTCCGGPKTASTARWNSRPARTSRGLRLAAAYPPIVK
jgi:hypothetical protein